MALDRAWTWTESECGPRIDLLKKFLFKYFVSAHTVSYINTDYTISKDIEKKLGYRLVFQQTSRCLIP